MSKECALEFFQRVAAMRHAQNKYYESRSFRDLAKAKKLEREIDGYIARGMAYLDSQKPSENPQQTLNFGM